MNTNKPHPDQEMIDGLRALADWLEQKDVGGLVANEGILSINVFLHSKEELAAHAKLIGSFTKQASGGYFFLRKEFSPCVRIEWNVKQDDVCEKVITQRVRPAEPEMVVPAKPERIEEIVEYVCPESILQHS